MKPTDSGTVPVNPPSLPKGGGAIKGMGEALGNGRKPQPVPPPPPPLHMVGTHTPASRPLAPPVAAAWKSAPSKPPFAATRVTPPVAGYKQRSQDWRYEHYVEVGALKAEISMKYGAVKDIKIANSTMKEMNKKMGISFISDSIEENPIAWTNPEGKIMLATDHPDYSNAKGGLDASKIRSTIVHEAMHFSSSGKRGLQGQTDLNIQNLNIDEYVTDYFSRETYKSLYPEEEYKTAYFTRDLGGDPVIWGGNYVKFMVEHGSATLSDFEEAYFRDPSKYKEPEEEVVKQWQAIAKRTARSPKQ
jgi:insecticidal toxin complex protein TccC